MYTVKKHLEKKVQKDIFFIEMDFKVAPKHFINMIEEGINDNSNLNYRTNVKGCMTSFTYFCEDLDFKILSQMCKDYLDQNIFLPRCRVTEAWGIKTSFNDYTKKHNHFQAVVSGICYLNKSNQKTIFPELDIEVTPDVGKVVLFHPSLYHFTKPSLELKSKYALVFNFHEIKPWENAEA
jgi:hypothetical protein